MELFHTWKYVDIVCRNSNSYITADNIDSTRRAVDNGAEAPLLIPNISMATLGTTNVSKSVRTSYKFETIAKVKLYSRSIT